MPATTRLSALALPEPPVLYLAFELSNRSWKLGFSTGLGQKPRIRSVPARDLEALVREVAAARRRLRLDASVPVVSCYEAGRDGFWLHRFLQAHKTYHNLVVDSASIEVNRRRRRRKTDRIDVLKLLGHAHALPQRRGPGPVRRPCPFTPGRGRAPPASRAPNPQRASAPG